MKKITAGHGSGGTLMNELIAGTIAKIFGMENVQLDDAAILEIPDAPLAFTTDTFTVTPLFFPGGNIGSLAVNGTVNDLAVMGAKPLYLSCGLIIEEGFDAADLEKILYSMKAEADHAGVKIVTGDTKVVPRGKADRIFINTSGIGTIDNKIQRREIAPGDRIIINGFIGDHGMAVMAERNRLSFSKGLFSDCAHLNHLIQKVTGAFPDAVKFMRDPTRGGVASVLNEIVQGKNFSAKIIEDTLPVRDEVNVICGMLGLDPLYVANEGKVLIIASEESADGIVDIMRKDDLGRNAGIIGGISTEFSGNAWLETKIGGRRILPPLAGEQLPRIC